MMSKYNIGTWSIAFPLILSVLIVMIIGILNHVKRLNYDASLNDLMLQIVNETNNEKIFHTINDESDISHNVNVLDISGGGYKNIQYIVYLIRVNDHLLNKNIDMLRMFNVFGGVSSGTIIGCAIGFRELMLKNISKNHKWDFIQFMKLFKYSDTQIAKCITLINNDSTQLNYGTLILQWLFYSYLFLKTKMVNTNSFTKIKTCNGYLGPLFSSKDKHTYLKKYFNFDMKDVLKSRTIITCGMKMMSNQSTPELLLFTNSTNPINDPYIIKSNSAISNVADIINIVTNTIGLYSVNEQYPNTWDAYLHINNVAMIVMSLFTNRSVNVSLNYFSLHTETRLVCGTNEGMLWYLKNINYVMNAQTIHYLKLIKYIQKNNAHNFVFKNDTWGLDLSDCATLHAIQTGVNISTNDSVAFIQNELLN
jgi:hypothetical protein